MPDASLVVTGVGMHTPVGTSANQTCAALRAGVSRLAVYPHFNAAGAPLSVGVVAADRRDASGVPGRTEHGA